MSRRALDPFLLSCFPVAFLILHMPFMPPALGALTEPDDGSPGRGPGESGGHTAQALRDPWSPGDAPPHQEAPGVRPARIHGCNWSEDVI